MPTLIVNNIPFDYPAPGASPGWGEPSTGWAVEVTKALIELLGPNDIPETSFNVANNISVFTNISNLVFNTGAVRSATIDYSIYRISDTVTYGNVEAGTIKIIYDNNAPVNSKWTLGVYNQVGTAGMQFSITDAGQVQYKSSNILGTGYSGEMHFRAKSLGQ
jgi:hypothetical protein